MDKPSDAPMFMAPGSASGAAKVRCPADREWPPVDEYLDEPEVTEYERVGGERLTALPSRLEHAEPHLRLDYLIGAYARDGYVGASDLKTRVSGGEEFASDTCVLKKGTDPATGRRYLEELSFEVVHKRPLANVNARVKAFAARGVRRQIAVFVLEGEVREWDASGERWRTLGEEHRIHDKCLARPLEVKALLDAAQADVAVALALEAKGNPAILEMKEKSRSRGHAQGLAAGRADSLLTVLVSRGLDVPKEIREKILGTSDVELLDRWIARAVVAASAGEVFNED